MRPALTTLLLAGIVSAATAGRAQAPEPPERVKGARTRPERTPTEAPPMEADKRERAGTEPTGFDPSGLVPVVPDPVMQAPGAEAPWVPDGASLETDAPGSGAAAAGDAGSAAAPQGPTPPSPPGPGGTGRKSTPASDRARLLLERYDANGNGKVDPAERETLRAEIRARLETALQRPSGPQAERSQRSTDLEQRLRARGREILKQYDADGDGTLSPTEREAYRAKHGAGLARFREWMLARYDTNRDGKLDPDERRAMRAQQPR